MTTRAYRVRCTLLAAEMVREAGEHRAIAASYQNGDGRAVALEMGDACEQIADELLERVVPAAPSADGGEETRHALPDAGEVDEPSIGDEPRACSDRSPAGADVFRTGGAS